MSITKELVRYATETSFEELPGEVIEMGKMCLLDNLGCTLGGYGMDLAKIVLETIKEINGKPESTIIGSEAKASCINAAFANSTLANALDFDDTYEVVSSAISHPGSTVIPAALAIGERIGASGTDILNSIILGYEIVIRIGEAIQPSAERYKKVWGLGTHQAFGSVTAAGRLLGLREKEMLNAFGIAGAFSPVPSTMKFQVRVGERPMSWVKDLAAYACYAGVFAALLAKKGFIGCQSILDGETGFWIMAGSDKCDFDMLTKGLGSEYRIMDLSFKPYSSCRYTHATLDAVHKLVKEHDIKADDVKSVIIKSTSVLSESFTDYKPMTPIEAQFSIPYTVAMVLLRIPPGPVWFKKEMLRNSKILKLASKVLVETDPDADKDFFENKKLRSVVEIALKNGKVYDACVEFAKGNPKNPLSVKEIKEKFKYLSSFRLNSSLVKSIIRTIERFEELTSLTPLMNLLIR